MIDRACLAVCRDHVLRGSGIAEKKAVMAAIPWREAAKGRKWFQITRRVSFRSDMSRGESGISERDRSSSKLGSTRGASNSTLLRRNSVLLDLDDSTLELESIVSKTLLLCFEGNAAGLV